MWGSVSREVEDGARQRSAGATAIQWASRAPPRPRGLSRRSDRHATGTHTQRRWRTLAGEERVAAAARRPDPPPRPSTSDPMAKGRHGRAGSRSTAARSRGQHCGRVAGLHQVDGPIQAVAPKVVGGKRSFVAHGLDDEVAPAACFAMHGGQDKTGTDLPSRPRCRARMR